MVDIALELLRAVVVGFILLFLLYGQHAKKICKTNGWKALVSGFALIFFGTLIDITDNFTGLNHFIIVGNTPVQAFLEQVVGYLLGFILLAVGIGRWLPKVIEYQEMIKKSLKKSNDEVKILRGFLPICASCKKIRDDEGFWRQIESYISEHSELKFTHSICPECAKKVYSEIGEFKRDK